MHATKVCTQLEATATGRKWLSNRVTETQLSKFVICASQHANSLASCHGSTIEPPHHKNALAIAEHTPVALSSQPGDFAKRGESAHPAAHTRQPACQPGMQCMPGCFCTCVLSTHAHMPGWGLGLIVAIQAERLGGGLWVIGCQCCQVSNINTQGAEASVTLLALCLPTTQHVEG